MRRLLLIIPALVVAAVSCDRATATFSEFREIDSRGWAYADSFAFTPSALTSEGERALKVAVRHGADYPYSNLWLEVSTQSGGRVTRDTVNMRLCDPYGRWLGHGFGASYQMETTVRPALRVDSGSRIGVRHIMRLDTLRGIDQIGVELTPEVR